MIILYYLDLRLIIGVVSIFLIIGSLFLFSLYKTTSYLVKALIEPFFSGILLGFVGFEISPNIMININLYFYIFMMIIGVSISIVLENLYKQSLIAEFIYILLTGILTGILLWSKWEFTYIFTFITIFIIILDILEKLKFIDFKPMKILSTLALLFLMIFLGFISCNVYNLSSILSGFITGMLLYYLCTKIVLDTKSYFLGLVSAIYSIIGLFIGIYIL